jgi:hypothetical protein
MASDGASTCGGQHVRDVSRIASVREIPAAPGHADGTGSHRPEPIRYRSRSGDAARQAQPLSRLPAEDARPDEANSKNQNLPKKGKPRPGWRLRVPSIGRPRTIQKSPERRLTPAHPPAGFQAHPSMRICSGIIFSVPSPLRARKGPDWPSLSTKTAASTSLQAIFRYLAAPP